jgi:hypothetical protein
LEGLSQYHIEIDNDAFCKNDPLSMSVLGAFYVRCASISGMVDIDIEDVFHLRNCCVDSEPLNEWGCSLHLVQGGRFANSAYPTTSADLCNFFRAVGSTINDATMLHRISMSKFSTFSSMVVDQLAHSFPTLKRLKIDRCGSFFNDFDRKKDDSILKMCQKGSLEFVDFSEDADDCYSFMPFHLPACDRVVYFRFNGIHADYARWIDSISFVW